MTPTVETPSVVRQNKDQQRKIERLIALCAEIRELLQIVAVKKRSVRILMDEISAGRVFDLERTV